jgi:predicted FMN-binding regulatory protein PaiB
MFEFPRFATDDPRHAVQLVRDHPFAMIVSATGGVPVATHVPVIEESPVDTTFVGATLLSHMARVNPHWRGFEGARRCWWCSAGRTATCRPPRTPPTRRCRRVNVPLAELMEGINPA